MKSGKRITQVLLLVLTLGFFAAYVSMGVDCHRRGGIYVSWVCLDVKEMPR